MSAGAAIPPTAATSGDIARRGDANGPPGTAGDQILREASEAIRASLRGPDRGARWGGDEFVVLAPNTATEAAQTLARRLLEQMAQRCGSNGAAPASIGVATF